VQNTKSIEFTPEMDISFDTAQGRVNVKWSASAWRKNINYHVKVDAPFLLVPLEVGEQGFSPLAKALNRLLRSDCDRRMPEFLELAALGGATHWLTTLERFGIETALTRLRKRFRKLEKYRELAWSLKKRGYAVSAYALLIRGTHNVYSIHKGSKGLLWPVAGSLHPREVEKIEINLECSHLPGWVSDPSTLLWEDEPAKQALRRALREIEELWIEKVRARFVADALENASK
jgi:hypothetical protein